MPGDILRKRKIAVLGSRSVGALATFIRHSLAVQTDTKTIYREIITGHPVHRKSLCRVVLSYNRSNFQQDRQLQRRRVRL